MADEPDVAAQRARLAEALARLVMSAYRAKTGAKRAAAAHAVDAGLACWLPGHAPTPPGARRPA